jgi:hypothetical protein
VHRESAILSFVIPYPRDLQSCGLVLEMFLTTLMQVEVKMFRASALGKS